MSDITKAFRFASFSADEDAEVRRFQSDLTSNGKCNKYWRTVNKGISFRGKCKNPECYVHKLNEYAWYTVGFGYFNIAEYFKKTPCPLCEKKDEISLKCCQLQMSTYWKRAESERWQLDRRK
jgi:hypothetical protein